MRSSFPSQRFSALAEGEAPRGVSGPTGSPAPRVTLLGSGAILPEVIKAAEALAQEGIASDVLSITSWSELAREGRRCVQAALHGAEAAGTPHITQLLEQCTGPIVAATDYVHAVPESIRAYVPQGRRYITLGTDGFGRSDTRAELRRHFGIDAQSIAEAARAGLRQPG